MTLFKSRLLIVVVIHTDHITLHPNTLVGSRPFLISATLQEWLHDADIQSLFLGLFRHFKKIIIKTTQKYKLSPKEKKGLYIWFQQHHLPVPEFKSAPYFYTPMLRLVLALHCLALSYVIYTGWQYYQSTKLYHFQQSYYKQQLEKNKHYNQKIAKQLEAMTTLPMFIQKTSYQNHRFVVSGLTKSQPLLQRSLTELFPTSTYHCQDQPGPYSYCEAQWP